MKSFELVFFDISDGVSIDEGTVRKLWELLAKRCHTISHKSLPDYSEHVHFVRNNPYRRWFLLSHGDEAIGSAYLTSMNEMGIYFPDPEHYRYLSNVIDFLLSDSMPLPPIRSVRQPEFIIHTPASDTVFQGSLKSLGYKEIQRSFRIG